MTRKAYAVTVKGWNKLTLAYSGKTAGKAKYNAYLEAQDAGYKIPFTDFRAIRLPQFDQEAAVGNKNTSLGWADGNETHGVFAQGRHYTHEA